MDASKLNQYQQFCYELDEIIYHDQEMDTILVWVLKRLPALLSLDRILSFSLKYQSSILSASGQKFKSAIAQLNYPQEERFSFSLEESPLCTEALARSPATTLIRPQDVPPDLQEHGIFGWSQFGSSLIYPLTRMNHGQCIMLGFFILQSSVSFDPWPEEQLKLLRSLNSRLSSGIFHHQALGQIQSLVNEQTKQLEWSLGVQKKLSEKMRHQIEELQRVNELKDEFMSTISHELNTPLTTMKMAIQMLKRIVNQNVDPRYDRYLGILEQEWNREFTLIKNLLKLQKLEGTNPNLSPQKINLINMVEVIAHKFTEKWQQEKNLSVHLDYDLDLADSNAFTLATDGDSLNSILEELLLNAGKFSEVGQQVTITLDRPGRERKKKLHLSITNYGFGITPEEQDLIFEKFHRGQGVTDRAIPGTGLGLALVKILVEHLHGSITVVSEVHPDYPPLAKITFNLCLPDLA
jgi:signal transduction histidine kinase